MNRTEAAHRRTQVTYGQLSRALSLLGVTRRRAGGEPPSDVYEHPDRGPVVTLPAYADDDRVLDHHLLAVRTLLDQFGIADPTTFDSELQKAG